MLTPVIMQKMYKIAVPQNKDLEHGKTIISDNFNLKRNELNTEDKKLS